MSGIYLRQGDAFIAMRETPYDAEAVLQELVAEHPEMLVGEDSGHGALLLVRREVAVTDSESSSGRWSLDHLFVDAAGVPTLVEVKRSSDTRARREGRRADARLRRQRSDLVERRPAPSLA